MENTFPEKVKRTEYKGRKGWLFVIPALITVCLFGWFPIIASFIVSLQRFSVIRTSWVGLSNFSYILNNPLTFTAFKNSLYFAFLSIGLTFLLPIFIAILLMEMKKNIIRIMMILWFIPVATMAGIIVWKYFYNVQYGLFNGILSTLGLPELRWLNDPRLAMLCLVLPGLIMYTLQSIPVSFYEAAELEGAGFWTKIWHITLPRLRPIICVMLILAIIGSLQVFDQPFIMTHGGPGFATYTVVLYIYQLAFSELSFGKGIALAIVLFFITMILVIIQRKVVKENVDV